MRDDMKNGCGYTYAQIGFGMESEGEEEGGGSVGKTVGGQYRQQRDQKTTKLSENQGSEATWR